MIMHPANPKLDGQNLSAIRDPDGFALFNEMVAVAKTKGAGTVDYRWPKPGASAPVEKTSYIKLFEPWGWVIGSGVYIDDMQAEFYGQVWKATFVGLVIALIMALLVILIARSIVRPLHRALQDDEKLDKAAFMKYRETPGLRLYDVRPLEAYKAAHIPGAQPLPAPAFDKFVKNLPEDKNTPIALYCTGGCLSPTAAMKTKALGYTNVKVYTGGYPEWSQGESGMVEADWLKETLAAGNPQVIIDLRIPAEVKAGHLPGAVAIAPAELEQAKGRFPARKNAPIVFYGPGSKEAAAQVVAWGYKMVRILPLTLAEWQAAGGPVVTGSPATEITFVPKPKPGTIGIAEFQQLLAHPAAKIKLVDVRNPDELEEGVITGSVNLPVDDIVQASKSVPADQELVLYCNTGVRAEMAHNLLAENGRANRYLDGKVTFADDKPAVTEN